MIVVDTNVITYFYVAGAGTDAAEAVFSRDPVWVAPLLWRSEFRNALVNLVRRGDVDLEAALRAMNDAERAMAGREYSVMSDDVIRTAAASACTAYDVEFVALARDLGVRLVTSDAALRRAFPTVAVSPADFVRRR